MRKDEPEMEKATVTFTNLYEFNDKGERIGDEFPEIAVLGYDGVRREIQSA